MLRHPSLYSKSCFPPPRAPRQWRPPPMALSPPRHLPEDASPQAPSLLRSQWLRGGHQLAEEPAPTPLAEDIQLSIRKLPEPQSRGHTAITCTTAPAMPPLDYPRLVHRRWREYRHPGRGDSARAPPSSMRTLRRFCPPGGLRHHRRCCSPPPQCGRGLSWVSSGGSWWSSWPSCRPCSHTMSGDTYYVR